MHFVVKATRIMNFNVVIHRTNEIQLNGGTPYDVGVDLDPSLSLKGMNRLK